jgi:hypothetical protein
MPEYKQWEYRVSTIGTFWSEPKDEQIDAVLNEWGEEGWEVISVNSVTNSNRVRLVAKRPLTPGARRRREWPD